MQTQLHFSNEENDSILKQHGWAVALIIIAVLYIAFRLWRLTSTCLWFDEIFSVHAARHGLSELFSFVAQDIIHPPLFYLLLKVWIFVGGESLLWLRLFPVLFSCAAILPLWFLCRELRLQTESIVLAFLFIAINGSLIKYAQEVRMYSPLFCLSLFSIWLFVKFFNSLENKTLVVLSIVNLLLIYTHYFGWLIVITELAFFILYSKEKQKEFLFSLACLILLFAPWVIAVVKAANANTGLQQNIGWMSKPGLMSLWQMFLSLNQPSYFPMSSNESPFLIFTPLLAIISLISIVLFLFYKQKPPDDTKNSSKSGTQNLFLFFAFLPIVIIFIASNIAPYSFWGTRHLIIVFAPYAILAAVGIQNCPPLLKDTAVYIIIGLVAFALFGQALRGVNQPIWCAWENLAQQLKQAEKKSAKIYATEELIAYHLWFAFEESDKNKFQIALLKNIPEVKEDAAYFLPRGFYEVKTQNADLITEESFWLAFRDTEFNTNKQPLKFFVDKGYAVEKPIEINSQGLKAFLVTITKKNETTDEHK